MNNATIAGMITLLVVAFVGITSITIYDDVETSMTAAAGTSADAINANFTANFYSGEQLAANVPIILAAGLILAVILGFAAAVRA